MRRLPRPMILVGLSLATLAIAPDSGRGPYPIAPQESVSEERFGTTIADPYRWMENLDDPRLYAWVDAQNELTRSSIDTALLTKLESEFEEIYSPDKRTKYGEVVEDLAQSQFRGRRWRDQIRPDAGIYNGVYDSPDGRYEIKTTSDSASDFKVLQIFDKQTESLLPDVLLVKFFGLLWAQDNASFYYSTDRDGRVGHNTPVIKRHVLGTSQGSDTVVFQGALPDTWLDLYEIGGEHFLIEGRGDLESLYRIDLASGERQLVLQDYRLLRFFAYADGQLYFTTFQEAKRGAIHALDVASGASRIVVPEADVGTLDAALLIDARLYATYIVDSAHVLRELPIDGSAGRDISLPDLGTAALSDKDGELRVRFASYTRLPVELRYDGEAGQLVPVDGEAATAPIDLAAERWTYVAHDGTDKPMWIVRKQGVELNPSTPVYLYGYGGFAINILPSFWTTAVPYLERGGVLVIVTLPGGHEYGDEWYDAGRLANKRNVFDDFARAAKSLYARGVSGPTKLAIGGGSNGGLLVGATMNLYPSLFRAAVPEVGVMDLTRFELFTAGKWWTDNYGFRDVETDFRTQLALSPYHNLVPQVYPATLVMTADLDDRVTPAHSYKYAARLQDVQRGEAPTLLHVKSGGSHSSASGVLQEKIRYQATKWAFIIESLGLE